MEQTFIAGLLWGATAAVFFATVLVSRKIKRLKKENGGLREKISFQASNIAYLEEPSYSCVHGPQRIEVPSQVAKAEPIYTQSNATVDYSSCAESGGPVDSVDTGYQEPPKNERPFLGLW